MKVLFTLAVGIGLGWFNAQWDVEGQIALEQHQLQLNMEPVFRTSMPDLEENLKLPELLLFWK